MDKELLETLPDESGREEPEPETEAASSTSVWPTFAPDLLSIAMVPVLVGLTVWGVVRASDGVEAALRLMLLVLPILTYLYRPRLMGLVLEPGQHAVSVFEVSWLGAWPQVTDENRQSLERLLRSYTHWNTAWVLTIMTALQVHISGAAPDSWVALQIWWDILALLIIHLLYRAYFFVRARRVA
ncbi:MAG: hypothetical protein GX100_04165 [candidate division WS1 bacterium]|nr:hypothetical protein [candidate division WS1 bacterium]